jgi:hypothetical protein
MRLLQDDLGKMNYTGRKGLRSRLWTLAVLIGLSGMAVAAQSLSSAAAAPAQPQAVSAPTSIPAEKAPAAPVTVLEETLLRVMTVEPLNSKRVKDDQPLLFTVSEDVVVGDVLAIPRGATVHGVVVKSKKAGRLTGSPELTLELLSLDLGGRSYPLDSYQFKVKGTSKTGPTEKKVVRGAAVGTVVGSFLSGVSATGPVRSDGSSRAASMATGAGVGAGVGAAVSAGTPGPGIWIPSESQLDFYLAAPVTVTPVSAKEAARLAQGLRPGGPTLYVRDDTP